MTTRGRQTSRAIATVLVVTGCQAAQDPPVRVSGQPAASSDPREFTLVASGDVLPHTAIIERAKADAGGNGYDFRPMLAGVRPVVSGAGLAICHMETVYGADGDHTGYPTFKSPPEVAEGLAATGYDACSTASHHTLDDGAEGIRRTLDAFDRAGVRHAGSARAEAESGATVVRAGSTKVAHLAYTYGTNGFPLPQGQPWAVNVIDPDRIVADARAARQAGADVVVVSLHRGTEWQDEPDERQLSLSRQLTASRTGGRPDIDLILGTHAHVPQAYEKVNGTWVVQGQRHLGRPRHGRPDRRRDVQPPGRHRSAGQRKHHRPFHLRPARAPGRPLGGEEGRVHPAGLRPRRRPRGQPQRRPRAGGEVVGVRDRIRSVVLSRGAAQDGLLMGR